MRGLSLWENETKKSREREKEREITRQRKISNDDVPSSSYALSVLNAQKVCV